MKSEKRKFTSEFKTRIIREHLENQVPVGKICERYNIHPNLFYKWKKELFTGAPDIFSRKKKGEKENIQYKKLEEKIREKDSIISEIVEDNLRLKKKLNGES